MELSPFGRSAKKRSRSSRVVALLLLRDRENLHGRHGLSYDRTLKEFTRAYSLTGAVPPHNNWTGHPQKRQCVLVFFYCYADATGEAANVTFSPASAWPSGICYHRLREFHSVYAKNRRLGVCAWCWAAGVHACLNANCIVPYYHLRPVTDESSRDGPVDVRNYSIHGWHQLKNKVDYFTSAAVATDSLVCVWWLKVSIVKFIKYTGSFR